MLEKSHVGCVIVESLSAKAIPPLNTKELTLEKDFMRVVDVANVLAATQTS